MVDVFKACREVSTLYCDSGACAPEPEVELECACGTTEVEALEALDAKIAEDYSLLRCVLSGMGCHKGPVQITVED